ncbi:MAG: hypothetical protein KVP17_002536 [Porospora cf. gigantea B]|uniref:uncharacterized protein n=1 Tax=Porospora cf. gigantea B TaxID=2853592 RepID=UPI003571DDB6|nr:MAG: hypothetical protein KVP17_002536 [Porospora cf. gigantea B]
MSDCSGLKKFTCTFFVMVFDFSANLEELCELRIAPDYLSVDRDISNACVDGCTATKRQARLFPASALFSSLVSALSRQGMKNFLDLESFFASLDITSDKRKSDLLIACPSATSLWAPALSPPRPSAAAAAFSLPARSTINKSPLVFTVRPSL